MSNNNQRLLEGEVVESPDTGEAVRLRELNRTLTRELHDAMEENESLRKRLATAGAPVSRLREKLQPFYQMLQAIFGDIDDLTSEAPNGAMPAGSADARVLAVWESWKTKLPGAPADVIDALMRHGQANATQLKIICKRDIKTIYSGIARLKTAGLIEKSGGRFLLKQL